MLGRTAAGFIGCLLAAGSAAAAEVVISVNKATQSMSVLVDGAEKYNWVVSTGTRGGPPEGTFGVERLHRRWFSRTYDNAPMPYSIFFQGPYAIHGTDKLAHLGRRASKGCVRLHPRDAAVLFDLVTRERANTTIVISRTEHVVARAVSPASDGKGVSEPATSAAMKAESVKPAAAVSAKPQPPLVTGSTGARRVAAPPAQTRKRAASSEQARKRARPMRARPMRVVRGYPPLVYAPYGPYGPVIVYEAYYPRRRY